MRHRLVPLLLASLLACEGGASTASGPTGPRAPATLAEVVTTLDFADPPLMGEVRVRPLVESHDLRYAVDLDADGRPEEEGPLGNGVRVGYRFETPGVYRILVRVHDGAREESASQFLVVNDPGAFETLREAGLDGVSGVGSRLAGIAATADEQVVYLSVPESDGVHAVRGFGLGPIWRIELAQGAGSGGLALSPDEELLYVDDGESIVAVETGGTPRILGPVAPAGWGAALETLPDGTILTGGETGLARVDPRSGRVLARFDEPAGPFGVSADGRLAAFVSHRLVAGDSDAVVFLLRTNDLSTVWSAPLGVGRPVEATAVPATRGERVYAAVRAVGWSHPRRFFSLGGTDGSIEHVLALDRGDRSAPQSRFLRPAAFSRDGRYVALALSREAYVVDTSTHLPRFATGLDDACCAVAASRDRLAFFFANELRNEVQKIELRP